MKINYIHHFYEKLKTDNLSFIFQGDFNDNITEKITDLSEHNIGRVNELGKLKNKVSLMIVECFQNIVRHGNETKSVSTNSTPQSFFLTRNIENVFYITSANLIENEEIDALKLKLEKINKLDKEQIKALYLEVLSNQEISGKGGAGLGFIEMARKSGQPLSFNFEKVNDKQSFFYFMVKMQGKTTSEESVQEHASLSDTIELHNVMRMESILMIYKGDFAHSTIMPVLKMIEENMSKHKEELITRQKVYFVLVETLQNICRHGKEKNGIQDAIFMIGRTGQKYIINAGNFMDNSQVESLKNKLTTINQLDSEELKSLYKKELKERNVSENGAGLGIIDMARKSSGKFMFDFKSYGDRTFFSLSVQV